MWATTRVLLLSLPYFASGLRGRRGGRKSSTFVYGSDGSNTCPAGASRLTEGECRTAASQLSLPYRGSSSESNRPGGCWVGGSGNANFNPSSGSGASGRRPICKSSPQFVYGRDGSNSCAAGASRLTEGECRTAASQLSLPFQGSRSQSNRPGGCWVGTGGNANFNPSGGAGSSGRRTICKGSGGGGDGGSPSPPPGNGMTTLNVRVIVLYDANGRPDSSAPWYDSRAGTIPLTADGNISNPGGSLATDLTSADIREIFEGVNEFYLDTGIRWNVVGPFFTKPTVPCGSTQLVCGEHKCRTEGYFTKYWGTINKQISKDGREERATNMFSNIPRELFKAGEYHFVYQKYMGWRSQGVVMGTSGSRDLRPSGEGHVSVATCGQWSNKFTSRPTKRPNTAPCGGSQNCGIGLHYTTAHELGHLLGLGHTDAPSIMTSGGRSAADSRFSKAHISTMQRHKGTPRLINSMASRLSGRPNTGSRWKRNTQCNR